MKSKNLLLCGAFAAVLPLAPLSAQQDSAGDAGPKKPNVEERIAKMKERLALTDEQVEQIKTIYADQKSKVDAINADASLTDEQKKEKIKPLKAETRTKIDGVLTDEQKAKLAEGKKGKKKAE